MRRGPRISDRAISLSSIRPACNHVALLTPEALLRVGLSPATKVPHLKERFRCIECTRRARAVFSIKCHGEACAAARGRSVAVDLNLSISGHRTNLGDYLAKEPRIPC